MAWRSGIRTKSQTAPIHSPLQNSPSTAIISLDALLKLAEWIQTRLPINQRGESCPKTSKSSLPPRRQRLGSQALDQLWNLLTSDQRQRTLTTLSSIVVRLLDAPRNEKEVRDEHS